MSSNHLKIQRKYKKNMNKSNLNKYINSQKIYLKVEIIIEKLDHCIYYCFFVRYSSSVSDFFPLYLMYGLNIVTEGGSILRMV